MLVPDEVIPDIRIPEVDACAERPCQNDGMCLREIGGRYTCVCRNYWEGQNCTIDACE